MAARKQTALKTDITFTGIRRQRSVAADACYLATYRPFCRTFGVSLEKQVTRLVRWNRKRLAALNRQQLSGVSGPRYAYKRNCRPSAVVVDQWRTRACTLRFCPFCHGRQAAKWFRRLRRAAWPGKADVPAKVVFFNGYMFDEEQASIDMYSDGLEVQNDVYRQQPRNIRRALAGARGGVLYRQLEPRYDAADELAGWSFRLAGLAVGDVGWKSRFELEFHRDCIRTVTKSRQLARLVGNIFAYPAFLRQCDPEHVMMAGEVTRRRRMFCGFGQCVGVANDG